MKRATEILRAATDELDALDIRFVVEVHKHLKLRWVAGGHRRMLVMPISPSDVRIRHHVRGQIRKMLRQDGLLI
jgi:hypothetical protein